MRQPLFTDVGARNARRPHRAAANLAPRAVGSATHARLRLGECQRAIILHAAGVATGRGESTAARGVCHAGAIAQHARNDTGSLRAQGRRRCEQHEGEGEWLHFSPRTTTTKEGLLRRRDAAQTRVIPETTSKRQDMQVSVPAVTATKKRLQSPGKTSTSTLATTTHIDTAIHLAMCTPRSRRARPDDTTRQAARG